jgi:class 3 adenylate cyclase
MVIFQEAGPGRADSGRQDHALNAARAALGVQQRTRGLNDEYRERVQPIELHLGVNTGEALVGAIKLGGAGSQRWTFTATGVVTNVAARLAGFSSGGDIVVGPVTAERIRHDFVLQTLGEKALKNVSEPIHLYRLIPPACTTRSSEARAT